MWEDFHEAIDLLAVRSRQRRLIPRRPEGVYLVDSDGKRLLNFGSNDYLGLATNGLVAAESGAVGATASGLICGWTFRHAALADRLAEWEQTESAVVFPTGYAACMGTVATLGQPGDLLISDQLNHASLIDGCRLSRAERVVFPHRDVDWIVSLLANERKKYRRVWIVTNSVFSMDGHVAPLGDLVDVCTRFDADLIVDEAHATGLMGESGSGVCEAMGVRDQVSIRIGTLSKALGAQGGFAVGPRMVMEYLVNHCRSLIFSTALALPAVEGALRSIDLVASQPERRTHVRRLSRSLREAMNINVDSIESDVPIIPIEIGSDSDALRAAKRLEELGFFVPAIRPPTVPEGKSRLRVSLSAAHSDQMIDRLVEALRSV